MLHTILAVAALVAAAAYYAFPLVRGVLGGNSSASPPPGELPPFLPAAAAVAPVPLRPTIGERTQALAVLQRHYVALGFQPDKAVELLEPHFPFILIDP